MSNFLRRSILALTALSVLIAVAAPSAWAAPNPSYSVAPNPPVSGQTATYTSTSTVDALLAVAKVEWDWDNNGTFDTVDEAAPWTATHVYPTAGAKTFQMRVTDNTPVTPLVTTEAQTVTVAQANRPPTSIFRFTPSSPLIGDDVLFSSDSTDPDAGDTLDYLWTFGDGSTSTERNPTHNYDEPGAVTVSLRVTDDAGVANTSSKEVTVRAPLVPGNRLPTARFVFSPTNPQVGKPVQFASSSVDPDGQVREQAWDLDGDGQFDDGTGDEVLYTFTTPGARTVRLRVTDNAGSSTIAERAVQVTAAPAARAGFLSPAPVIRLNGQILARGSRIRILQIRAPRKALVAVGCRGKSCPVPVRRKRVKNRSVRFKTYERFLRRGTKLVISIRKPKTIGAYTVYKIRAGKAPVRTDMCLRPGKKKPYRCFR